MNKRHILVVDDDPSVLDLLAEFLSAPDRFIDKARNRMTAEGMIRKKRYDLVICDVFLPDTKHLEVVDFVKAIDLDYRIILISGYIGAGIEDIDSDEAFTRNTILMEAERKGVWATLEKPFDLDRLSAVVDDALRSDND